MDEVLKFAIGKGPLNSQPTRNYIKSKIIYFNEQVDKNDVTYRRLNEEFRAANVVFIKVMMYEYKEVSEADLGKKALFDAIRSHKKKLDKFNTSTVSMQRRTITDFQNVGNISRRMDDPTFRINHNIVKQTEVYRRNLMMSLAVLEAFDKALLEFRRMINEMKEKLDINYNFGENY